MLFNMGSRASTALRSEHVGDFEVLCGLPTHPGIIYVYTTFVDTISPGRRRCAVQTILRACFLYRCVVRRCLPLQAVMCCYSGCCGWLGAEIMAALPEDTVEIISTTEEGAVRDRVSARFIVMAAHKDSLDKWLVTNRSAVFFDVASKLCKQFGEVGVRVRVHVRASLI